MVLSKFFYHRETILELMIVTSQHITKHVFINTCWILTLGFPVSVSSPRIGLVASPCIDSSRLPSACYSASRPRTGTPLSVLVLLFYIVDPRILGKPSSITLSPLHPCSPENMYLYTYRRTRNYFFAV